MSRCLLSCTLLFSMVAGAQSDAGLARGWFVSGAGASAYDVTTVDVGACGTRAVHVTTKGLEPKGPIGVLQTFRADDFRGARVRYTATVDAHELTGWGGLFFRADDATRKTLAFDDMRARPLRGTRSCARLSVVVDVPATAELLSLGLSLAGPGTLELSDIALEKVPAGEPVTSGPGQVEGRIGDVWFTDALVSSNINTRFNLKLTRRAPGVWNDATGDAEARIEGDRVITKLLSISTGSTPLLISGALTVRHEGDITTVEGDWGTMVRKYPVKITLTPSQLDMQWGFYERHLKVEPASQLQAGCLFFAQKAGPTTYSDALEVCGGVLSPTPPPVQTVVTFLMAGFRRYGSGIPGPRPPIAPVLPVQNPLPPR